MSVVTTPPRGLISLFGLRDMGAVPAELAGVIAPTIDITEFALTNRESYTLGSAGAGTPGLLTPTGGDLDPTVPPGELWYVHQFGLSTGVIAAGVSVKIRPVLVNGTNYFARGAAHVGSAGEAILAFADRMFIATPGQSLRIWQEAVTGAGTAITASVLITRLRI